MTFKEMIREDIADVFLDPDEFGEKHTVNGREGVRIVTDEFELFNREKFKKEVKDDSTSAQRGIIYVKASDVGRLPKSGRQIRIDDVNFRIENAVDENGIYALTIQVIR